jgi:hypothetical protein
MRPDLAKTLGILFGASAAEIAYRHGFEIDMNRMIARVERVTPSIPLAPVLSVSLATGWSFTKHTKGRILTHR